MFIIQTIIYIESQTKLAIVLLLGIGYIYINWCRVIVRLEVLAKIPKNNYLS